MKKMIKALVTAAVAGSMCISALGLAACGSETVEVPGKSAYEIAVDNGFVGTETEWLASLQVETPGKSAYQIAVENGFEGTEEEWLASLQVETPGKTAYQIAVENGFEGTQAEWLASLRVEVPATVSSMTSTLGVNEKGQTVVSIRFTMSDGSSQTKDVVMTRRVVDAQIHTDSIIMTAADALKLKNKEEGDYNGFVWSVSYDDGSFGYIPVQPSQLLGVLPFDADHHEGPDQEPWDGTFEVGRVYRFTFIYEKNWYTTRTVFVFICNDVSTIAEHAQYGYNINYPRYLQKGEEFDPKTMFIAKDYNLHDLLSETYQGSYWGNNQYSYIVPVTEEMLEGTVDTSETGRIEFTVNYENDDNDRTIYVYDPEVSVVESISINGNDLPDALLDGDIMISAGENAEAELREILSGYEGVTLYVYYCVNVNGSNYAQIPVTEDMIDYSEVDLTTPGIYSAYIKYQGASNSVDVTVLPNMSAAQKEHELTGTGLTLLTLMMQGKVVTRADLYDNGYCELFAPEESGELASLTSMIGYVQYTLNNNVLEIQYGDDNLAIFTVDTEENTFVAYDFEAAELTATVYNGSLPMGSDYSLDFTLKTYANGYGEFIVDMGEETTFIVAYTLENGVLTILPADAHLAFTVGEENALTFIYD